VKPQGAGGNDYNLQDLLPPPFYMGGAPTTWPAQVKRQTAVQGAMSKQGVRNDSPSKKTGGELDSSGYSD